MKKKVKYANGNIKKNRDGTPILEEVVRDSGCINPSFICKHNLTTLSKRKYFIEALFPYEENKYDPKVKE